MKKRMRRVTQHSCYRLSKWQRKLRRTKFFCFSLLMISKLQSM